MYCSVLRLWMTGTSAECNSKINILRIYTTIYFDCQATTSFGLRAEMAHVCSDYNKVNWLLVMFQRNESQEHINFGILSCSKTIKIFRLCYLFISIYWTDINYKITHKELERYLIKWTDQFSCTSCVYRWDTCLWMGYC